MLSCDICGKQLKMDSTRQFATCTHCGMRYEMDALQSMLSQNQNVTPSSKEGRSKADLLADNAEKFMELKEYEKAEKDFCTLADQHPQDWRGWWGLFLIPFHKGIKSFLDLKDFQNSERNAQNAFKMADDSILYVLKEQYDLQWNEYFKELLENVNSTDVIRLFILLLSGFPQTESDLWIHEYSFLDHIISNVLFKRAYTLSSLEDKIYRAHMGYINVDWVSVLADPSKKLMELSISQNIINFLTNAKSCVDEDVTVTNMYYANSQYSYINEDFNKVTYMVEKATDIRYIVDKIIVFYSGSPGVNKTTFFSEMRSHENFTIYRKEGRGYGNIRLLPFSASVNRATTDGYQLGSTNEHGLIIETRRAITALEKAELEEELQQRANKKKSILSSREVCGLCLACGGKYSFLKNTCKNCGRSRDDAYIKKLREQI